MDLAATLSQSGSRRPFAHGIFSLILKWLCLLLRPDPGRARRLAIAYRPKPPERDYFTGDFVGDNNTTFEQLLLNMTKAEWKSAAHPYRMGDDLQRETMVLVADGGRVHAGTLSPKTLTTAQVDNAAPS